MKKLLVISSCHPDNWEEEQKRGWDIVEYIPFPDVPFDETEFKELGFKLGILIDKENDQLGEKILNISMQGEFSLCMRVYHLMRMSGLEWWVAIQDKENHFLKWRKI